MRLLLVEDDRLLEVGLEGVEVGAAELVPLRHDHEGVGALDRLHGVLRVLDLVAQVEHVVAAEIFDEFVCERCSSFLYRFLIIKIISDCNMLVFCIACLSRLCII